RAGIDQSRVRSQRLEGRRHVRSQSRQFVHGRHGDEETHGGVQETADGSGEAARRKPPTQ
ncbi:hypothetical protein M9458_047259, partial [Cirrhinus mrigala]